MSTLKLLFSYRGRIRRKPFWLGIFLPVTLMAIAIRFIPEDYTYDGSVNMVSYAILTWILTAGFAKRLHDRNYSGWFQLIFIVPAATLYILTAIFGANTWIVALEFATLLIGFWIIIETGFISGTIGQNRFAEDPALYDTPDSKWRPRSKQAKQHHSNPKQDLELPQKLDTSNHAPTLGEAKSQSVTRKSKESGEKILESWFNDDEPEILRSTASAFEGVPKEPDDTDMPSAQTTPTPSFEADSTNSANAPAGTGLKNRKLAEEDEQDSLYETDRFLEILQDRATTNPSHALYLEIGAESGNSWAKLEIAATWLSDPNISHNRAELAVGYLRDLADASQSYLGAEIEAAYFLAEIYRVGMRYTRPNEDLSFKYFIRAASLGHEAAQHSLASQVARSRHHNNGEALIQPLVNSALHSKESATALLQLVEFDWSIIYIESVALVLRTLVDQGNGQAAKFLGRMLLERYDLELGARILNRADKLDSQTMDKIVDVIQVGRAEDSVINDLVDLLQKHADLGDPYAQYQIAVAFKNGIGMPQDNLMAFVHINLASARVHGRDRDKLIKLRDELRDSLSEEEIMIAQEIVREQYRS